MKSLFGRRLFRLFLMFSLVPSILLAVAGYYVTIGSTAMSGDNIAVSPTELTNYYGQLISDRIVPYLREEFEEKPHLLVDFSMFLCNGKVEWVQSVSDLTRQEIDAVASAAVTRPTGTVEASGRFFQYATLDSGLNCIKVAGVIHDSTYGELITSLQIAHTIQESDRDLMKRYAFFAAVLFLIMTLSSVLLAYYFSSRVAKGLSSPVVALSRASQEIAAGNFDSEVSITSTGELQDLVNSFNLMARQLNSLTGKLAQSERVAAWRNIARRFAHDLKNPLQPITVSLYRIEKLLKDKGTFDTVQEPLRAASEELKQLTALAERFSHLAKLPAPKMEQVDMRQFLESFADLYSESLSEFDFVLDLPSEPQPAMIDPAYFREALHNLLRNSIEASPLGNRIILRLTHRSEQIEISVQDYGSGMSMDVIKSARSPYFTTKEKGSGMGLAVVEKIVDELGGQLVIDSEPDAGTTATIILKDEHPNAG